MKQKKVHKEDVFKAREFHQTTIERCRSVWTKIAEFKQKSTISELDTDQLEALKHHFTLVLSAHYQQVKLLPHWGGTAQLGQTYYFQKISHGIFGIVDHCTDQNSIYPFNETIGPKTPTIPYCSWRITFKLIGLPMDQQSLYFSRQCLSMNKN